MHRTAREAFFQFVVLYLLGDPDRAPLKVSSITCRPSSHGHCGSLIAEGIKIWDTFTGMVYAAYADRTLSLLRDSDPEHDALVSPLMPDCGRSHSDRDRDKIEISWAPNNGQDSKRLPVCVRSFPSGLSYAGARGGVHGPERLPTLRPPRDRRSEATGPSASHCCTLARALSRLRVTGVHEANLPHLADRASELACRLPSPPLIRPRREPHGWGLAQPPRGPRPRGDG
jgi:hypothetical protein